MRSGFVAFLVAVMLAGAADAQVTGRANVLTSDTFAIGNQVFRLYGVDAVEFHQFCFVDGEPWACGAAATRAFQVLLDPIVVTCDPVGEATSDGVFATCTSEEGDIADIMARQGWALAVPEQTDAYLAAEEAARAAQLGVWRGDILPPSDYLADISAIEERLGERAHNEAARIAARILREAGDYLTVFSGFEVVDDATDGTEQLMLFPLVGQGFLDDAIPDRGVFTWQQPAAALRDWFDDVAVGARGAAGRTIIATLSTATNANVETEGPEDFHAAIVAAAEPILAQGGRPVLLVTGIYPEWVDAWFRDAPLEGAEITLPTEDDARTLMGTIDGIQVHRAAVPGGEAYLLTADALVSVGFVPDATGAIVTPSIVGFEEGPRLALTFTMAADWGDGPITLIAYPYEPPGNPYEGGS